MTARQMKHLSDERLDELIRELIHAEVNGDDVCRLYQWGEDQQLLIAELIGEQNERTGDDDDSDVG